LDKRWVLVIDGYEGLLQKAVNFLSGTVSEYLNYVLPVKGIDEVSDDTLGQNNIIAVGLTAENRILKLCQDRSKIVVPDKAEGYSVYVGESVYNPEAQMIAIAGFDAPGVLYGCMDFCNRYCGSILYKTGYIYAERYFERGFQKELPEWSTSVAPAIGTRAIWTWGHVIYDYRKFFDNMAQLRLNEAVIWNGHVPLNARDVVEYAHSLNIKVIWGFAWGWANGCNELVKTMNLDTLPQLKENILQTFENEYADTNADGIYFQSFTETSTEQIGGKSIAQIVTELVNDVAGTLLERHPGLHIQFGLHATSVKNHLDVLKNVDSRIHIVWEDCGAFPYSYSPEETEGFEETLQLTGQLLRLRGEKEHFGVVLKGMMNLDWTSFERFSDSFILGERTGTFLRKRQREKDRVWKLVQSGWLQNGECVRKTVELIAREGKDAIVEALVEDALLENKITLPVAVYAELLWTPQTDVASIIGDVAKYPCVEFANA